MALARNRRHARLFLAGELDVTGVPWLCGRLGDLLTSAPGLRTVSVDLTALTFVDVAGARELAALHQWLRGHCKHVEILGMRAQVRHVIDLICPEFFGAGPGEPPSAWPSGPVLADGAFPRPGEPSPGAGEPLPGTDLLPRPGAGAAAPGLAPHPREGDRPGNPSRPQEQARNSRKARPRRGARYDVSEPRRPGGGAR